MSLPKFKGICRECGHDSTKDWPNVGTRGHIDHDKYTLQQAVERIMERPDLRITSSAYFDLTTEEVIELIQGKK